jgi:hypothetical protein
VVISLKAIRQPYQQTQKERCKGIVSITLILIPQQQLLPQGHQLPQRVRDGRKLQCFANQSRSHGLYTRHNDGNYCYHQHGQRKQHKLRNNGGHGNNNHDNKVSLRARTRAFSSATYTASTPSTCTTSATLIHATKVRKLQQQAQTTTTKTQP